MACSATAWWSKSGLQQPLANRTWRALVSDYSPTVPVSEYLAATTPVTFKSGESLCRVRSHVRFLLLVCPMSSFVLFQAKRPAE